MGLPSLEERIRYEREKIEKRIPARTDDHEVPEEEEE
jgi:hypothetical protein